jgi:hypothetical protein
MWWPLLFACGRTPPADTPIDSDPVDTAPVLDTAKPEETDVPDTDTDVPDTDPPDTGDPDHYEGNGLNPDPGQTLCAIVIPVAGGDRVGIMKVDVKTREWSTVDEWELPERSANLQTAGLAWFQGSWVFAASDGDGQRVMQLTPGDVHVELGAFTLIENITTDGAFVYAIEGSDLFRYPTADDLGAHHDGVLLGRGFPARLGFGDGTFLSAAATATSVARYGSELDLRGDISLEGWDAAIWGISIVGDTFFLLDDGLHTVAPVIGVFGLADGKRLDTVPFMSGLTMQPSGLWCEVG